MKSALRQSGARAKLVASFRTSPRSQAPAVTEPRPVHKPAPLLGQMTSLGAPRRPAFYPPVPSLAESVRASPPAGANVPTPAEPPAALVIAAPPAAVPTPPTAPPPIVAAPAAAAAAAAPAAPAAAPKPRPGAPRTVVQLFQAQVAHRITAHEAADAQRQARARRALVAASRPRVRELTVQVTPPRHPRDDPIYVPVGDAYVPTKPAAATTAAAITAVSFPVPTPPVAPSSPPSAAVVTDDDTVGWDNTEPPPPPPSRAPQPAPPPTLLLPLRLRPQSPKPPARRSSSEGGDASPLDDGSSGGGGASSAPPSTASAPDATSEEAPSVDADAIDTPTELPPFVPANRASGDELPARVPIQPLFIQPLLLVEPLRVGPLIPAPLGFGASHPIAPGHDGDGAAVAPPQPSADDLLGGGSGAAPEAPRRRRRPNPFFAIGRAARGFWREKIAACFCGPQVSLDV
ncbi:hypothetical protein Rsub_07980 [Raphidocelis subcapitata]|uniref:Uncharacterized protein n=1 Tax=Raphidocelis subcapitata TaxID=307507 RepID=A0A2V0P4L7_9CHLO|nr:hypothetical protein Rsub_07980 [Raphidocelis subcapitata]|eukprot:GBF94808.1 hypothetical protein Rsub_07980 [Raphidocelis subcapitata]